MPGTTTAGSPWVKMRVRAAAPGSCTTVQFLECMSLATSALPIARSSRCVAELSRPGEGTVIERGSKPSWMRGSRVPFLLPTRVLPMVPPCPHFAGQTTSSSERKLTAPRQRRGRSRDMRLTTMGGGAAALALLGVLATAPPASATTSATGTSSATPVVSFVSRARRCRPDHPSRSATASCPAARWAGARRDRTCGQAPRREATGVFPRRGPSPTEEHPAYRDSLLCGGSASTVPAQHPRGTDT